MHHLLSSAKLDQNAKALAKVLPVPGQNYPVLENLQTRYSFLSPEIKRVWMAVRRAYERWQETDPDAFKDRLDDVVSNALVPKELPLKNGGNICDWLAATSEFDNCKLWTVCRQLYPPTTNPNETIGEIMSRQEHEDFDIARRHLGHALQQIGEIFERHGFELEDMPALSRDSNTLKLSAFLELALMLQAPSNGPGPSGVLHLYKVATHDAV
jgi:hypothetical protein